MNTNEFNFLIKESCPMIGKLIHLVLFRRVNVVGMMGYCVKIIFYGLKIFACKIHIFDLISFNKQFLFYKRCNKNTYWNIRLRTCGKKTKNLLTSTINPINHCYFFSKDTCPETALLNDDCASTPCKCGRKGGLTCQNNICK